MSDQDIQFDNHRLFHSDETYVKIKGVWHYLYRAIDKQGNTLDWMLSRNCNKKSAKRFFKKLLGNKHTIDPRVITVDNPSSGF
jgi:transposase-like protein